jgi:uncharacterized membrane protein YwzB
MKKSVIFRLVCIALLYVALCYILLDAMIKSGTPLNLRTLFPFVAAGIIIFVPLYKKYFKNATSHDNGKKERK